MNKIIINFLVLFFSFQASATDIKNGELFADQTYKVEVKFIPEFAKLQLPTSTQYTPFQEASPACDLDRPESCNMTLTFNLGKASIEVFDDDQKVGSTVANIFGTTSFPCAVTTNHECDTTLPKDTTLSITGTHNIPVTITNSANQQLLVDMNFKPSGVSVTFSNKPGEVLASTRFDSNEFISSAIVNSQQINHKSYIHTNAEWAIINEELKKIRSQEYLDRD
jgi:hypothetical protein